MSHPLRQYAESEDPDLLFIGTGEEYDRAILGLARFPNHPDRIAYSKTTLIALLAQEFEGDLEGALEWYDFNISGAYMGPRTPVLVEDDFD